MKLNGSDIIAEVLIEQGVDTIFGYPGEKRCSISIMHFINTEIKFIIS